MKGFGPELKVGLLVILGALILVYFSFKIESIPFFKKQQGKSVVVFFDSVAGLDPQSPVKLAGVNVGKVESIILEGNKAKTVIRLNEGMELDKGTEATIKNIGFLGEKYVQLLPPPEKTIPIPEGGVVSESISQADVDQILSQLNSIAKDVKAFTNSAKNVFGGAEGQEGLQKIFDNLQSMSTNMNEASKSFKQIDKIVENMEEISKNLSQLVKENRQVVSKTIKNFEIFSAALNEKLPEFTSQVERLSNKLEGVIDENKDAFKSSLNNIKDASAKLGTSLEAVNNISKKIESGEGTLGKLIYDEKAYDNVNETLQGVKKLVGKIEEFQTSVEFRAERQLEFDETKGYFGLKIQPRPERFYLIELIDDPLGKLQTKDRLIQTIEPATGAVTTQRIIEQERKNILKISALFGHKFDNLTLRIGLMESSFGLGTDFSLFNNKVRLSFDAFEFGGENDTNRPHLKFTSRYEIYKNIFLQAGFDNFLNRERRTVFLGGGIWFNDEDLKYLLGRVSLPSF